MPVFRTNVFVAILTSVGSFAVFFAEHTCHLFRSFALLPRGSSDEQIVLFFVYLGENLSHFGGLLNVYSQEQDLKFFEYRRRFWFDLLLI